MASLTFVFNSRYAAIRIVRSRWPVDPGRDPAGPRSSAEAPGPPSSAASRPPCGDDSPGQASYSCPQSRTYLRASLWTPHTPARHGRSAAIARGAPASCVPRLLPFFGRELAPRLPPSRPLRTNARLGARATAGAAEGVGAEAQQGARVRAPRSSTPAAAVSAAGCEFADSDVCSAGPDRQEAA